MINCFVEDYVFQEYYKGKFYSQPVDSILYPVSTNRTMYMGTVILFWIQTFVIIVFFVVVTQDIMIFVSNKRKKYKECVARHFKDNDDQGRHYIRD